MSTVFDPTGTRSVRIESTATALSSISYLDGHAGTISLFHREKNCQPDGTICDVPVVHGNSLRGLLRDHCAAVFWRMLGSPELPPVVFDLLWSGGSLAKAGAGHVLSHRDLVRVRDLVPMVALFGGSGGGRIIPGKLRVMKLTPYAAETAHILPPHPDLPASDLPAVRDLLQIEELTRRDDAKRPELAPAIAGMRAAIEAGTGVGADGKPIADDDAGPDLGRTMQMRYGVETLIAGTRLNWGISVRDGTPAELALLAAGIGAWLADGGHVGGRSSTGHGRLGLDVAQWDTITAPSITVGDTSLVEPGGGSDLERHVTEHRERVLDALNLFK